MGTQWIASTARLPVEGQSIEFLLDYRDICLMGMYHHRTFLSRWSIYDATRVRTWRPSAASLAAAPHPPVVREDDCQHA